MTEPEITFNSIIKKLQFGIEGKMFGARCIKSSNGKTAVIFWKDEIIVKLNAEDEKKALSLSESRPGTHLYAPDKKMKSWVTLPFIHSDKWEYLIKKSILNLNNLTNKLTTMKTMTCKQLGGACYKEFQANTFDEMAEMSKKHGMEMFQKGDEAHIKAMNKMKELMKSPDAMREWFGNMKKEFDALSE